MTQTIWQLTTSLKGGNSKHKAKLFNLNITYSITFTAVVDSMIVASVAINSGLVGAVVVFNIEEFAVELLVTITVVDGFTFGGAVVGVVVACGVTLGCGVGAFVGTGVEAFVGRCVEAFVGTGVGAFVGTGVGAFVGTGVGTVDRVVKFFME